MTVGFFDPAGAVRCNAANHVQREVANLGAPSVEKQVVVVADSLTGGADERFIDLLALVPGVGSVSEESLLNVVAAVFQLAGPFSDVVGGDREG